MSMLRQIQIAIHHEIGNNIVGRGKGYIVYLGKEEVARLKSELNEYPYMQAMITGSYLEATLEVMGCPVVRVMEDSYLKVHSKGEDCGR